MPRWRMWLVGGAIVLAATSFAGAAGSGVQAGHVGGIVPPMGVQPAAGGNLIYHGGPVMHTNKTYAIYWIPSGFSVSANYRSVIDGYFADVAAASGTTTNVYSVETQYYDLAPNPNPGPVTTTSTFGGSIIDTGALPADGCAYNNPPPAGVTNCLSDAQITSKINAVIAAQGWTKNNSTQFFLFTPQGVGSCFGANQASGCAYTDYCAYHGYTNGFIYANQPYAAHAGCDTGERPNGDDADPTINVASHEHREAINDFQLNAWYDSQGAEGSDKCAWNFGSPINGPAGARYNQTINGHHYYLQQEWSNDGSQCLLLYSGAPPPPPPPAGPTISSFNPTSGSVGTLVTIKGSGFTGASSLKFNGTSATMWLIDSNTQIRSLVPSGATTGPISVTKGGQTGTSSTNFTVNGGGGGAISVSGFTPTSGPVGTIVTINGSGFTGASSVKFNGVSASQWLVSSNTRIYARVPNGATTGKVSVTKGGQTGTSAANFTVT